MKSFARSHTAEQTNIAALLPTPFPLLVISAFLGCLAYFQASIEPPPLLLIGLCLLLVCVWLTLRYFQQRQPRSQSLSLINASLLIGIGCLGASAYSQYRSQTLADDAMRLPQDGQAWNVDGIVSQSEIIAADRRRYRVSQPLLDGQQISADIRFTASIDAFVDSSGDTPGNIAVGDRISAYVVLYSPGSAIVPNGFDFQRWAFFDGLLASGYALYPPQVITHNDANSGFWQNIRAHIAQTVQHDFSSAKAPLLHTLLLGDRQGLSEAQWQQFRLAGLAHLLAISGMHIGMIAFTMYAAVRIIASLISRVVLYHSVHRYAAFLAIVCAAGYVMLAGGSVSANRAFVMITLLMLGIILEINTLRYHSISLAALIIMLYQPFAVTTAGFQLSFAAVWVIVAYYLHKGSTRREFAWQKPIFHSRMARAIQDIVVTTALITLITAPILWWHFQVLYPWGILGNIWAIPLMAFLIMPLIFIYFFASFTNFGLIIAGCIEIALDVLLLWADWVGSLPYAQWNMPPTSINMPLLGCFVGFCVLVYFRRLRLLHFIFLGCVLCIAVIVQQRMPIAQAIIWPNKRLLALYDGQSWIALGDNPAAFYRKQFQRYWRVPVADVLMDNHPAQFLFARWQCGTTGDENCTAPDQSMVFDYAGGVLRCTTRHQAACRTKDGRAIVGDDVVFLYNQDGRLWSTISFYGRPWQTTPLWPPDQ